MLTAGGEPLCKSTVLSVGSRRLPGTAQRDVLSNGSILSKKKERFPRLSDPLEGEQAPPKLDWRLATHLFKDSREMLAGDEPAVESDVTNGKVGTREQSFRVAYSYFGQKLMDRTTRFAAEKRG